MTRNLTYELYDLEKLIRSVQQTFGATDASINEIKNALALETGRVKKALTEEVFSIEDERHLERYIQYHQQALIRLIDSTRETLVVNSRDLFTGDFNFECLKQLDILLNYVERHFSKYFDLNAKAPDTYLLSVKRDVKKSYFDFKIRLTDLKADDKVLEVALHPLRKFIFGTAERDSSYRMIIYVKEIEKEISRILSSSPTSINDELWSMMFYLNCNSVGTFYCYTQIIDNLLNFRNSSLEKIEALSLQLKKINQAQVKPGIVYNPQAQSLKSQLASYLIEEIEYVERLAGLNNKTEKMTGDTSTKFIFDLSVAQLAYFIKVLVDCKVLLNTNTSDLLRAVSKASYTKRAENISFDSLRSKFYNIEASTTDSLKKVMSKMIAYIERPDA